MKKLILFYSILLIIISNLSCKKKEPEIILPKPTKTELLCGKNWKYVSSQISNDSIKYTYVNISDCEYDDILIFSKDGTLIKKNGAIFCDANENQILNLTWKWNSTETGIYIDNVYYSLIYLGTDLGIAFVIEQNKNTNGGFDIIRKTYTFD